jgi:(p)ppGpp synthase/HD superfamily hydrolase
MGNRTVVANELNKVIRLAANLHAGQTDKSGRPYLGHAERVANMVRNSGGTWVQEQAAWLHDAIEDTEATPQFLLDKGIPSTVVDIIRAMTHGNNEPNINYWQRIVHTPGARLVKLCDIYDNLDPSRLCYLDEKTQERLIGKYASALAVLCKPEGPADPFCYACGNSMQPAGSFRYVCPSCGNIDEHF